MQPPADSRRTPILRFCEPIRLRRAWAACAARCALLQCVGELALYSRYRRAVPSARARGAVSRGRRSTSGCQRLRTLLNTTVIADAHGVVRRGLRTLLEMRPQWRVVAEALDGTEAAAHPLPLKTPPAVRVERIVL